MKISVFNPVTIIATWFYSGLIPKAPGTVGTLAALPFAGYFYHAFGLDGLWAATLLACVIGWVISARYVAITRREDPKEVVIDEVAGMWLALAIVITAQQQFNFAQMHGMAGFLIGILLPSFILFRWFDIRKPLLIGLCDRHVKGGLGIMLDDLIAAIAAALSNIALLMALGALQAA